uniref:NADH-ubiquinone oxidoreductase chain 4 n=1 Tax=Elysia cornigera TaxID=698696 RepID=A0A342LD42_9GAST|nr:NADH dehydrogenase subunit 4 [Elysia cornigera]ANP26527.1 NADH dehydrogenase subunit 4 [Elysia cornigera]
MYGVISLGFIFYWGSSIVCFSMLCCMCIILMSHSFSCSLNMFFNMSPLSSFMLMLSVVLCILSLISTPNSKSYSYQCTISLLGGFLALAFSSSNMINFYIWFEASLIPTLILIICWGYQPERLQAGSYMMLYTVAASLPLLLILIWRCVDAGSMNIFVMGNSSPQILASVLIFVYGAFLVKLPMYSVHLWLPKAHVEAPLAGSMILAGILLKLGGFGLFQMNKCFSLLSSYSTSFIITCMSLWGGLLAVMVCLRQVDVKSYVAYSSVGHMGLVSAGVIMDRTWGVSSALITMIAHGFASSALFCLAFFSYSKSHSRAMPYMKGMLKLYPILSFWWFIFCCINMAAPPTINLLGEMLIIPSAWFSFWGLAVVLTIMVFMSASYNMYLYSSINHGDGSFYLTSGTNLNCSEGICLISHFVPLLIIFKFLNISYL